MTELERKASQLTQAEIDALYEQVMREETKVKQEIFCLWWIAVNKCDEETAKKFYRTFLNMIGQAKSGLY
ncbi:MAG: hypothetical protein N3A69_00440 [Leptospiraceae bacterium]|nr:hypothetical protein [Leptospiraceae bacterium]